MVSTISAKTEHTIHTYAQIADIIRQPFQAVDNRIHSQLASDVELINIISHHIIDSGGKRLRPMIALLAGFAGMASTSHPNDAPQALLDVAAVVELLHTATLLHDDVVDESSLRRGKKTAHTLWGNAQSVLVGDYLISKAFSMIVAIKNQRVLEIMAQATSDIAEGEVLQLCNLGDPTTTEARYRKVIHFKTARMFEAAAEGAAAVVDPSLALCQPMQRYAHHLGIAFQLMDDLLDYQGDASATGKNVGDDLAEGKPTLPLIYTLEHGAEADRTVIHNAIADGRAAELDEVITAIQRSGGLDYTMKAAQKEAQLARSALQVLSDSVYKDALIALTELAITRSH